MLRHIFSIEGIFLNIKTKNTFYLISMYKFFLIFFCFLITSCAFTPKVIDTKEELEESANTRLDESGGSNLKFERDTKKLEELISSGKIDVKRDRTLFQNNITHVMSTCNLPSLQLVLDKGAPLDDINSFGDTPLSLAVAGKSLACAEFLLTKGARHSGKFSYDNSLLHLAAKNSDVPMIRLLIKHKVCPLELGFMGTPLLDVTILDKPTYTVLKNYLDFYVKNVGPKCPDEKALPKK
jgi:ankyrin repeat protein